jgi:sialidase-1
VFVQRSTDDGQTFDAPREITAAAKLPNGGLQLSGKDAPLVFSGPADPASRAAMTLRTSWDGGVTWTSALPISGLPAAYSDLVQLDDKTIGLLYETGDFGANETITYRRIETKQLTTASQVR